MKTLTLIISAVVTILMNLHLGANAQGTGIEYPYSTTNYTTIQTCRASVADCDFYSCMAKNRQCDLTRFTKYCEKLRPYLSNPHVSWTGKKFINDVLLCQQSNMKSIANLPVEIPFACDFVETMAQSWQSLSFASVSLEQDACALSLMDWAQVFIVMHKDIGDQAALRDVALFGMGMCGYNYITSVLYGLYLMDPETGLASQAALGLGTYPADPPNSPLMENEAFIKFIEATDNYSLF